MLFIAENPLPVLSLNVLGLGLDVIYGVNYDHEKEKDISSITLIVNFVFGKYTKHWNLNG